jgi:molybdopterin/thiamine biosynthesis adenylyltransferase
MEKLEKFTHEAAYRGKESVAKLAKFRLTVCGAGALGSNLIDNLTRQGFGAIKVIDFDRVDLHNVNTQVFGVKDAGALKVDALKNLVYRNVGVEITAVNKKLESGNAKTLLKDADLIVDCFDNHEARQIIQDEVRARKLTCLHTGLFEDYGEVVWDENYKVPRNSAVGDVCDYPLARNIIMLTVAVSAEEVLSFAIDKTPRRKNWSVTLKDLKVQEMFFGK